jgi:Pretoxin HINT domain
VGMLAVGDPLTQHEGLPVPVEAVSEVREIATVYNLRVADYHTYFVGCQAWGFSAWAHNAEYAVLPYPGGASGECALAERVVNPDGSIAYSWVTEAADGPGASNIKKFSSATDATNAVFSGGDQIVPNTGLTPTLTNSYPITRLFSQSGNLSPRLGDRLGRGGEGAVYRDLDNPGYVVKVFKEKSQLNKAQLQFANLAKGRADRGRKRAGRRTR